MSTDKISNAYKAMGQDLYKRPKQRIITAKEMGIHINGLNVGQERKGPTALQRMAQGYKDHKEQIEARAKELEKENAENYKKAMRNLKNNTKGADK